jgi:hypothetical protein
VMTFPVVLPILTVADTVTTLQVTAEAAVA